MTFIFRINKKNILLLVLWIMALVTFSQNSYNSSEELKENAQIYFENHEYVKAFPLYSQLLSLDKSDPELQYRFGVCLLYSDRSDTYKPITYLKKALNQVSTPDIYYYLGYANHINYNFPAAISFYKEYLEKAGRKENKSFQVERKIEMCNNGMNMLRSVKDLFVLDKSEVARQEFFRSYDLQNYGGKLIRKPEEFKSKEDQKLNENDYIFFDANANIIYFSAYGKENKSNRDIYYRLKTEDAWSAPIRLPDVINSIYDEEYPVMMPDGKTLYFSSNGHNTMGGYDIFKSVYNEQNKTWSSPVNINFPFNTPTDDILFVPDTLESTAWFASTRNSIEGKIMVYRVGIIKRPGGSEDLAAIFAKNKQLTESDLQAIKNRARLDVNISEQEYDNQPDTEDLISKAEDEHQENLQKISEDLEKKRYEQAIIDSAKYYVNRLEENIDDFDSLRQKAVAVAAAKRLESKRLRESIKSNLALASTASNLEGIRKATALANKDMMRAEKLDYEATELQDFAKDVKVQIDRQRETFADINRRYGDAEQAVINESPDRALAIIGGMNSILQEIPDINESGNPFGKNEEDLNITYPSNISEGEFQAFAVNTQGGKPQIESFDARYDEFIPKIESKQVESIESEFSNNPSERLQEYINILRDSQKSLEIQIAETQKQIEQSSVKFKTIAEEDKKNQLRLLNQLEEEKSQLASQNEWMSQQVEEKQQQLKDLQLSSADSTKKIETYQELNQELEHYFDFDKKNFVANALLPVSTQITQYTIDGSGALQSETSSPELIPSSEIEFANQNQDLIANQSTQIVADTRRLQKENQFLLRKIDQKINQLELKATEAFNQANQLLSTARNTSVNNRQKALDQANAKFKEAALINEEYKTYQEKRKEVTQVITDQEALINQQEKDYKTINSELQQGNFKAAEDTYKSMENSYRNHQSMADFSSELDYETGALVNKNHQPGLKEDVYQLTSTGEIIKSVGQAAEDWTSFDDFSEDIVNPVQTRLVLSPNLQLQSRQTQFTDIFKPQTPEKDSSLKELSIVIPNEITNSDNSLISNFADQIKGLELKLNELIRKRKILQKYYQSQLTKSEEIEQQSLNLLKNPSLTSDLLQQANNKALESKKELYKASKAAAIIRQYDENIDAYAELISESLKTSKEMNDLISSGRQDDALLKSVQMQRNIAEIDQRKVDDSAFNFAVNELFVEIPAELNTPENQEYVLVDSKIQRNNQAALYKLFHEESYPVKVASFEPLEKLYENSLVMGNPSNSKHSTETAGANTSNTSNTKTNTTNPINTASDTAKIASTESKTDIPNSNGAQKTQNTENPINLQTSVALNAQGTTVESNSTQNSIKPDTNINQSVKIASLQSYHPQSFTNVEDFRQALSALNSTGQQHISLLNAQSASLIALAEEKLNKSNAFSLQAENASPQQKPALQDSSKKYLYEALAIKELAQSFNAFVENEKEKQNQITQSTFNIENELKNKRLPAARDAFISLQEKVEDYDSNTGEKLAELSQNLEKNNEIERKMDSAYNYSQDMANKSVKLLSEATEERKEAEGKRNAFKRREILKSAENKELEATRLQNESDKALKAGNEFYQQKSVIVAFSAVAPEIQNLSSLSLPNQPIANNQEAVFEGIDDRKAEIIEGQLNTTSNLPLETKNQQTPLAKTDDIHVYQRENFKAEMISEELDLLKREIALLVQSQNQSLPERENYIVSKKIEILRQKADSLEYEANQAFGFANQVLNSLSKADQEKAQDKGRDFDTYLKELKGKIEVLLSEAASLKQRAQRSNNIGTREDLFNQAKDKEEVAMYLILEEFEVIAQKNKTRYRKNQLILEQLLMENASPEERELMRNIFDQIDDYFAQAEQKRKKANEPGISFNMKKILLQDAYSLEMKGLDLQQKAKAMIEDKDKNSMLAYQQDKATEEESIALQNESNIGQDSIISQNEISQEQSESNAVSERILIPQKNQDKQVPIVAQENEDGIYYKVQFTALKELKNTNDFRGISEITAERVVGTDYIRYFSGKFRDISNAIIRRNSIRASGYDDAFIKTWRNGEEVNLLSLNNSQESTSSAAAPSFNTQTQIGGVDFSATNISSLQGVYYTVQVGVYSRPRTSAMIFGISPLYHKRMDNGYWIYYSGIYKSIADANSRKEEIRQKGVGDAFVVAFSNGNQVNLAEARKQISRGEETPSDDAIVILEDASIQLNRKWDMSQSQTSIQTNQNSDQLVYKVQVGVYSNPINLNWIATQLDNIGKVDRYQNTNGKYVYTVGNFTTENEARKLLQEVNDLVSDAFIVGFENGQKKYIR